MSAHQASLEPALLRALSSGALSLAEAWGLQDQLLLQRPSEVLWVPAHLFPAAERLHLSQLSPPEGRPLH